MSRRNMLTVLLVGWTSWSLSAAEKTSLEPPVYLPNGETFKTWEVPLAFSRTYYVDQSHAQASDDNPGTKDQPFASISRAAEVLQPGERVVVGAGIYREHVKPARGGAGPDRMISYEAAPGAKVVLRGSHLVTTPWVAADRAGPKLWTTTLSADLFADRNPFKEANLTDEQIDKCMPWALGTKGKPPNTLRRGLVFQDSRRLKQVAGYENLTKSAGTYWVADDGVTIHVRPLEDQDPNQATFEVTTRDFIFAPEAFGLGYIRVKALTIEHSGNRFPRPQQGALSTQRGHHWIIEDNVVRQCNSIGIDIGDQFDTSGPKLAEGGQHIVRSNTVTDCGIGGIEGKAIEHTLIEDNTIARCGWQRALRIYETGGIKVHCTVATLIRRNLVTDTTEAPGIWMDYANVNSRCTRNVIINARAPSGGIFMEASQKPNIVDNNFVWATRGNGIYQHDCDELTIAHNFIGRSTASAVRMQIIKGRKVGGRLSTAKRNRILNNIFVDNGSMLAISDPDNVCDGNVFAGSKEPFDLAAWRQAHGWDERSVTANLKADFDRAAMTLTFSASGDPARCSRVDGITHDFWGKPVDNKTVSPGPFGPPTTQPARVPIDANASPAQAARPPPGSREP